MIDCGGYVPPSTYTGINMSMKGAFCKTDKSLTVSLNGKVYTIPNGDNRYEEVLELIRSGNWEAIPDIADMGSRITKLSQGAVQVKDGIVYVNGEALPSALSKTVIGFAEEKLDYQPLLKFWERLQANPSNSAVQRLYDCLEVNHHPITENGCFLAYKKVRRGTDGNLWDIHTFRNGKGTFRNNPGDKPEMPRNKVDDRNEVTCSNGLHVSSWDYACNHFGTRDDVLVEVLVDPADIVSIPRGLIAA